MEINHEIQGENPNDLFQINPKECIFLKENDIISLEKSYSYVTDGNINDFTHYIPSNTHITTLMVCQDFFYQQIEDWCNFQDQLALLFTHLPSLTNLTDLFLKLEIFGQGSSQEFRKINLDSIKSQGNSSKMGSYFSQRNQNKFKIEFNNILDMLSCIVKDNTQLKDNLNIHLIIQIGQEQNTKQFIDSLSGIDNLKSLEIKYYCDQLSIEDSQENQQNLRNRFLFQNLTRQISKCLHLKNLKLIIPHAIKLSPISVNQNENKNTFNQEVMLLTNALTECKSLQNVSLHLPIQFFFQDYLKQRNVSEKSLRSNLQMLSKAKQIKVFELHLIKFKNTPNMRRRTQQINDLVSYLKQGVVQNLPRLVRYQS